MVMDYSDTHVLGAAQAAPVQPSFKRWLKHSFYFKRTQQFVSVDDELAIIEAVRQAEMQHHAEIRVVIEAHLPSHLAYQINTRMRAEQLFASLGVWDTQYNTGVLLYINLCERQIELLADRGIHAQVPSTYWYAVCGQLSVAFSRLEFKQGIIACIAELSRLLNENLSKIGANHNEISNKPILLD